MNQAPARGAGKQVRRNIGATLRTNHFGGLRWQWRRRLSCEKRSGDIDAHTAVDPPCLVHGKSQNDPADEIARTFEPRRGHGDNHRENPRSNSGLSLGNERGVSGASGNVSNTGGQNLVEASTTAFRSPANGVTDQPTNDDRDQADVPASYFENEI